MSDLHTTYVRAKEILLEKGWSCDGPRGVDGSVCIIIACCDAYREIHGVDVLHSNDHRLIHVTLRKLIDRICVPEWNDDPTRTIDDVIAVLDQAIIQTAPAEELVSV